MAVEASVSTATTSDAVSLDLETNVEIDVDFATGGGNITAIEYEIQSKSKHESSVCKSELTSDGSAAQTYDVPACLMSPGGNRDWRVKVNSRTGSGAVTIRVSKSARNY
jgi:hypothetical protein